MKRDEEFCIFHGDNTMMLKWLFFNLEKYEYFIIILIILIILIIIITYLQFTTSTELIHLSNTTTVFLQPSTIKFLHFLWTTIWAPMQPTTYTVWWSSAVISVVSVTFSIIHLFPISSQRAGFFGVSLIVNHSSFIIYHLSFIIHHSSFTIHHSSFTIHYSSFIIHHSSFIIHQSSFIIHHSSRPFHPLTRTVYDTQLLQYSSGEPYAQSPSSPWQADFPPSARWSRAFRSTFRIP